MVTSDANSTASPGPLGCNNHRPDPKSNTSPRADDTNDERGRCIDSSLTASVPRDVLMEIVHEVEYRGTGQSSLDGSHQLSTGLHILDQLVAILLATVEESVQVHSRVDQREQSHEATNDAHRDPVVWADIIIVRHVGLGGHNDYIARSEKLDTELAIYAASCRKMFFFQHELYIYPTNLADYILETQ